MNVHPKPFLSVIIPTFNRAEKLSLCLKKLFEQSLARQAYEVWVINDGSTDETEQVLDQWSNVWPQCHHLHQKNAGQGAARNLALTHAQGDIVLFIGDDIYAEPNFLEEHVKFHQEHPEETMSALGLTEWFKDAPITPYMQWLTHGGPQFAYHKLKKHEAASFWFFYTSNLSIKKTLLQKEPFDLEFKGYGWEDIELGYRLQKKQALKLIYIPEALAFHDHFLPEEGLKNKMRAIGKNGKIFQSKYPELKILPTGVKKQVLSFVSASLFRSPLKLISRFIPRLKPLYWTLESKFHFLQSLKDL